MTNSESRNWIWPIAVALTILLALAGAPSNATTLDINIGEDSARGALSGPLRLGMGAAVYDLGATYSDERDARLRMGHVGLLVTGDAGTRGPEVRAGLGPRVIVADMRGASGSALALGGQFEVRLLETQRLGVSGYGWISPSVLSFSDFDRYTELAVAVDYQVIRDAAVYLGYRQTRFKVDDGPNAKVDDGLHLGLRLQF